MTDRGKNSTGEKNGKVLRFERDSAFFVKRGDAKRAKNDPVSASVMYSEALARDPYDLETRLAAAQTLTDMSRYNDSNKLLIPYMHLDEEFRKEAYCIVGFNLLGMGETDGAGMCFNRFFELSTEVSERTDAMLDALDYIESLDEDDRPVLTDAAVADYDTRTFEGFRAFEAGAFERAEAELLPVSKVFPDDTEILYKLALSCFCQFKTEECSKHLEKLLAKSPDHWSALGMKLMCAKAMNNELEMSRLVHKLETCDSFDPEELLRVNGALLEVRAFDAALRTAKRLTKIMPYDRLTNHRLALSYIGLKQYASAAEVYDRLLKIDRSDRIARYYRSGCLEAERDPSCAFVKEPLMPQYQMPIAVVMEDVKSLLDGSRSSDKLSIKERWTDEPDFRELVRWAFTLGEFNISHAMIALLSLGGDKRAEMILREVIADIDTRDSVTNEVLGALKRMDAEEPFFAIAEGKLLEGRVNIVDLSDMHIPKAYREIFPRISRTAGDRLTGEVLSVASSFAERFIMSSIKDLRPIRSDQSAALSAAMEFLACERCGLIPREDLAESYGVTEKRLSNALTRILDAFFSGADEGRAGEDDDPDPDDGSVG